MANSFFRFKEFEVHQDKTAMKVTTDACLFGAWIAKRLHEKAGTLSPQNLLDIGTGTGLLSLMIAQKTEAFPITAVEIDAEAARQALENARSSPWAKRILIVQADINSYLAGSAFDIIISNPPFYENELRSGRREKNIAHHDEGLVLSELMLLIRKWITREGYFYLLFPWKRKKEASELLKKAGLMISGATAVRQSPGHDSFRWMIEGKAGDWEETERLTEEISIRDHNGLYSDQFVQLLQDYYLHL